MEFDGSGRSYYGECVFLNYYYYFIELLQRFLRSVSFYELEILNTIGTNLSNLESCLLPFLVANL